MFWSLVMTLMAMAFIASPTHASTAVEAGRKLVAEKKCEACHASKTLGNATTIYLRKDRKVTSLAKLKSQVALCNSELNLGLFPDEEEHVAAFLNATYYKLPAP